MRYQLIVSKRISLSKLSESCARKVVKSLKIPHDVAIRKIKKTYQRSKVRYLMITRLEVGQPYTSTRKLKTKKNANQTHRWSDL